MTLGRSIFRAAITKLGSVSPTFAKPDTPASSRGVKNIHVLSINMMLNTTGHWLDDDKFCSVLEQAGPLGVGMLDQLTKSHKPLVEIESKRSIAHTTLKMLIEMASDLDFLHDRKARAVHYHLSGLIEGSDEPAKVNEYQELQGRLFPKGLRVVNLPYIEEGGAAVALEQAVSPELRAKLAAIPVGDKTLDDLFGAWIAAGHKLGEAVQKRAKLKASLQGEGSAVEDIDIKAGRTQWIKAVRGLLWGIDIHPGFRALEERVNATLDEAISVGLRARGSSEPVGSGEALSGDGDEDENENGEDEQGEEFEDSEDNDQSDDEQPEAMTE